MTAERRSPLDSGWTLAAVYLAFVAASLPLQRTIWQAVAATTDAALAQVPAALFGNWALSFAALAAAAWLAPRRSDALSCGAALWLSAHARALAIAIAVAAAAAALIVAWAVLDAFPNSGDEYAYLFQAERFADGRLWADAPPLDYTFVPYRTWISDGKWLSQYPPGWPLALALALVIGIPAWTVNALLGSAGAAGLAAQSWRFADRALVPVVLALYALTPFFLLNAGSFHSHALSALLIVGVCLCCLRYGESGGARWLVLGGALIGLVGMTRYFSLVLLLPALAWWLFVENRRQRLRIVAWMGLGGLPVLGLLLAYQGLVTGTPFRSTYALIAVPDVDLSLAPEDIRRGVVITIYRIAELGVWASPVLFGVYVLCLLGKLEHRAIAFYDLVFPAFVAGFVLFPDLGGNRYGPRYYFEAFPLMLATILSAAPAVLAAARRAWPRPLGLHVAAVTGLYLLTACPFALTAFHAQVEARQEPYRLAQALGLKHAIVVIRTTSGAGMLAEDLARNEPALDAPVLYARDEATVGELRRRFPDRTVWAYERDDPRRPGRLAPAQAFGELAPATRR